MFELVDNRANKAVIKVIGVGGGGGNAIDYMINSKKIEQVDFINANTDAAALGRSVAKVLQLGLGRTAGLGAGANPEVGKESAADDKDKIEDFLAGTDMLFIAAGMGGGTGTGAAPVIAQIAKNLGILTVAIVTTPFIFEGNKRMTVAKLGIENLSKVVDSLIVIPNAKLLPVLGKEITLLEAFKAVNDVLLNAVQGITELITMPGLINVDFSDVRTVMSEMGLAMMGTGTAKGDHRAKKAAEAAISSPLLDNIDLCGAKGILVNITGGNSLSIAEFEEIGELIRTRLAAEDATFIVGTVIDKQMEDELRVTIVATGLEASSGEHRGTGTTSHCSSLGSNSYISKVGEYRDNGLKDRESVQEHFSEVALSRLKNDELTKVRINSNYTKNMHGLANISANNQIESLDYLDIPTFLRKQSEE